MTRYRTMSNNKEQMPPDNSSLEERRRLIEIWRRTDVKLYVVAKVGLR